MSEKATVNEFYQYLRFLRHPVWMHDKAVFEDRIVNPIFKPKQSSSSTAALEQLGELFRSLVGRHDKAKVARLGELAPTWQVRFLDMSERERRCCKLSLSLVHGCRLTASILVSYI